MVYHKSGQDGNEVGEIHRCHDKMGVSSERGLSVRASYTRVKLHLTHLAFMRLESPEE